MNKRTSRHDDDDYPDSPTASDRGDQRQRLIAMM